jgi:EpsI family protein
MQLPEFLGSWYGQDAAVTAAEKEVLGPGTEFARKIYTDGNGDQLYVSIVLSGPDMMTSIHRPERCLPAQGWSLLDSRAVPIRMPKPESGVLDVTRLHDLQYARNQARDTIKDRNGQPIPIYNLNYYWFIGSRETCASHYARLYVDMRDRILHGYNQRWAYVTVVSNVTKNLQPFGKDETQTDAMIQDFIKQLAPVILQPSIRLN